MFRYSPAVNAKKLNDTIRDFCAYYGQDNIIDVFRAETSITQGAVGMLTFGELPDDQQNDINAYVGKNFAKVITAATGAKFVKERDKFIRGMTPFHPDIQAFLE